MRYDIGRFGEQSCKRTRIGSFLQCSIEIAEDNVLKSDADTPQVPSHGLGRDSEPRRKRVNIFAKLINKVPAMYST